jgi:hypothetical protein
MEPFETLDNRLAGATTRAKLSDCTIYNLTNERYQSMGLLETVVTNYSSFRAYFSGSAPWLE